jgi:GTP diphosphokinase / guanosine-3',5'-bis(diphosphate) 3'-diphosphatase
MANPKKVNIEREIDEIISEVTKYLPSFDEKKFWKAFKFARDAHADQLRKDGKTPYIWHPVETVKILVDLRVDEATLITALLHDVPEDTERTIEEVDKLFGDKVAFLVNGVTKLSKVHYKHHMEERQIESLKKLLVHSAKDPRVILIKLADRLHNMRTLGNVNPKKRLRIAKETIEIYVPIANLLGISDLKRTLEDLCFKHLFVSDYEKITDYIKHNEKKSEELLETTIQITEKALKKSGIKTLKVYGRQKTPYSIFKKTIRQNKEINELEDLMALRILVENQNDCYIALGIVHSIFKPKLARFKDYIAIPKPNGYQSLHTVVFGIKGEITEFQIRTETMHIDGKYGIAAHYFYRDKQNKTATHGQKNYQKQSSKWAEKILEYQKANYNPKHFLEALKIDIFHDRIFTFTPKGDSIDLPAGASPIDFAYAIHTEVGDNAIKAKINDVIVPLTTSLKTGDIIEIITSDKQKGPDREWLIFTKTNLAKNKIREALRKTSRKIKLTVGRKLLQKEFDRAGVGLIEEASRKKIKELIIKKKDEINCKNMDDVLVAIGEGLLNPITIIKILFPKTYFQKEQSWLTRKLFPKVPNGKTRIELKIKAIDKLGAGQDILGILSNQNLNIYKLKITTRGLQNVFTMDLTIEVDSFEQLSYICEQLEQIDEIIEVRRQFGKKRIQFLLVALATVLMWAVHPLITYYLCQEPGMQQYSNFIIYLGIVMLFLLVDNLKRITKRNFPIFRKTGSNALWLLTFLIGNFALFTIIAEIYFYELRFNWIIVFGLILFVYAYLVSEYVEYKLESNN